MNSSLLDSWSYDRVMLQLLGTAGTVRRMRGLTKSLINVSHCKVQGEELGI